MKSNLSLLLDTHVLTFYSNLPPPLLIMFRRYQVLSNFIHVLIFIDVEILVLFLFSSGSVGLETNREQGRVGTERAALRPAVADSVLEFTPHQRRGSPRMAKKVHL